MKCVRWVAVFIISVQATSLNATEWSTVVKPALSQVVRIEVLKDGDEHPTICSGVVLNATAGFVLTAAHCISGKAEDISITVNGRHAELARVNRNAKVEAAVLRFSPKKETAMPLAKESPEAGTDIAVLGFSFGVEKLVTQFGRIAQSYNEETGTIWLDANVIPGCSGGAIINVNGELVGMTSRIYYSGPSSLGAAIPVETLRDFVEQYLPAKNP
jgi:S1-C subfamily serine protease